MMKMTIDPVCGMEIDAKKTPYYSVYRNKTYYFCSQRCKKEFDEDPEGFIIE